METIVRAVERAAGLFLAAVALLIFAAVVLRYVFGTNLPDAFDFSRYLQGIAIFWGLAITTYRGGHIAVDLLWEAVGPLGKWIIDLVARIVVTIFFGLLAWRLLVRLPSVIGSHVTTSDLGLPVWPFYFVAILGVVACTLVSMIALAQSLIARSARRG